MPSIRLAALLTILLAIAMPGQAHHSFAVHFVSDRTVTVQGVVSDYRFTNPHGMVTFQVVDEDGEKHEWRAETNSPSILRRRGWSKNSLQPGDEITIEGYPARDDPYYMRVASIEKSDGTRLVGQAMRD